MVTRRRGAASVGSKPAEEKPPSGRIAAESADGLIEVVDNASSVEIFDLTCGVRAELQKPGRLVAAQVFRSDSRVGGRAVLTFDLGGRLYVVKYATPALYFSPGLKVNVVEDLPVGRLRGNEIAVRGSIIFIQNPLLVPVIAHLDGTVGCCECKVVVQKRDGVGFFERPVWVGWVLWFGWFAEEIKTIVYCYVHSGGNVGEHIQKTVDIDLMFDPPPPPGLPQKLAAFCPFKMDP